MPERSSNGENDPPCYLVSMKITHLAPLVLAASFGLMEAADAQSRVRLAQPSQSAERAPRRAAPDAASDKVTELREAAQVLLDSGMPDEAKRLLAIAKKMSAAQKLPPAPRRIRGADWNNKEARVAMIEAIADGYAEIGEAPREEAMRFFASIGRAQLNGGDDSAPLPDILREGDGPVQDKLTRIVMEGADVLARLGKKEAAKKAGELGRFYANRSAPPSEPAPQDPAGQDALSGLGYVSDSEPTKRNTLGSIGYGGDPKPGLRAPKKTPRANDLTYIEGRVPVLKLARDAFDLDGRGAVTPGNKDSLAWMNWMVAMGQNRISDDKVTLPPIPEGFTGMDMLCEIISKAGDVYNKTGQPDNGKRCLDLASYYLMRDRGEAVDNSASRPDPAASNLDTEEEPSEPEEMDEVESMMRRALELERRIGEVELKLRAIQQELRPRRSGRR